MKLPLTLRAGVLAAFVIQSTLAPLAPLSPFSSLGGIAAAQVRLPALGEGASEEFTSGTERKLGEQIMGEIRRDPDYLDDPVLLEYVQSLWQPLVAAARARGEVDPDVDTQFAWEVFLVRDRSVNAFALPGGWVGVYLGLIALTQTRDELASVLAHELTHVTQRHIARGISNSQKQSLIAVAGMILAILAASRSSNVDAMQAAVMGSQAAAIQGQLNFSRDMEREADRVGFTLMAAAGFAPAGMGAMFDRLDSANRINDAGAYPYLRSHPLTTERMSEARARHLLSGNDRNEGTLLHGFMQGRARVLMDTDPKNLRRLQQALSEPGKAGATAPSPYERAAQLYAAALASTLLREPATAMLAWREAAQLVASHSGGGVADARRQLQLLQAHLQLASGRPDAALATLQALEGPMSRAVMLQRAQVALQWQRQGGGDAAATELRHSTEALQVWLAEHRHDASAWSSLSATAGAIGLQLRSLRAHAESRAAEGDVTGAIDRMRAAQTAARSASAGQDFIEASIIDARLRQLTALRRQMALEMRAQQRGGSRPDGDPAEAPQLAGAGAIAR